MQMHHSLTDNTNLIDFSGGTQKKRLVGQYYNQKTDGIDPALAAPTYSLFRRIRLLLHSLVTPPAMSLYLDIAAS
jgi:hypothetical protein